MATKPRYIASANGSRTPVNNAARRQQLQQQAASVGQVMSRQSISNQARRLSAGGKGG